MLESFNWSLREPELAVRPLRFLERAINTNGFAVNAQVIDGRVGHNSRHCIVAYCLFLFQPKLAIKAGL